MIKHSTQYRKLVSEGLPPGRWLSVQAAEHFSGLPLNWTNPMPGSVDVESVRRHFPDGETGHQLPTLVTTHSFLCFSAATVNQPPVLVTVRFPEFSRSLVFNLTLSLRACSCRPARSWNLSAYSAGWPGWSWDSASAHPSFRSCSHCHIHKIALDIFSF